MAAQQAEPRMSSARPQPPSAKQPSAKVVLSSAAEVQEEGAAEANCHHLDGFLQQVEPQLNW